ncbi:mannitol dehydrogenase family protein [Enterovibrio nigricans]|uniref:D-arabinitol 4-dehydrogenase n=1 Tax=Enterovibrio nigricans DSM 22720 TaxID=1121868 RepID=A0A1T4VE87_9GAMM|nr:mannitol dehydrogenase family protein [Enterovibrio nigricans]PKF49914.1 mannitol dehydrogenase family protein [Enterovibrio nigricans]SKA63247.1 D-arabinitol 4-dehydrogenase [Enterovibrio nigricans DSM 22720]
MSDHKRIVHFGIGAFHRGHQAYYLQKLNEQLPEPERWYYTSINLRAETSEIPRTLKKQNGVYHFKRIAPNGEAEYIRIESIDHIEDASSDLSSVARVFSCKNVKALTITVTEGGYYLNDNDALNSDHAEIQHDIDVIRHAIGQPKTLYGYLAVALLARQKLADGAITVATCDNLRNNGNRLENAFKQFVLLTGNDILLNWISDNVTFPCSMVDRITPVPPTNNLVDDVLKATGVSDACPIMGEDFEQWVIQDTFATEFPPLESVGVTFTQNVHAYEEAKIRILNGAHFLLSYVGALRGYVTYDQNVRDPELFEWLREYHQNEVIPTIYDRPFDMEDYRSTILSRFGNAYIADSIERIAMDSISKFPQFVLPTVRLNLERGYIPDAATKLIAHWFAFLSLFVQKRFSFNYKDSYLNVAENWIAQSDPIAAFINDPDIWQGLNQRFPLYGEKLAEEIRLTLESYQERYP